MRILGIDPGYGRVGWGVIEGNGTDWKPVAYGCIETSPKKDISARLANIEEGILFILNKYQPDAAGVEELFFKKNVTTGIKVAQARGVMLLTLHKHGVQVVGVKPLQAKQAVTGYGNADKKQVQYMVAMMLKLPKKSFQDDAADALAVALYAGSVVKRT